MKETAIIGGKPSGKVLSKCLLEAVLNRICKREGLSRGYLSDMEPGDDKRALIDDITIITINLGNQTLK